MSLREREMDRERDVTASFGLSTQTQDSGHCYKCFYVYVYICMWVCLSKYVLQMRYLSIYVYIDKKCVYACICVLCMYHEKNVHVYVLQ